MSFELKNKVALISGGASGIGLEIAKEFLKKGLRGATLADINEDNGKRALEEIRSQYGTKKAIYVKTDLTNKQSYEGEHLLLNLIKQKNGTIYGTLLGLEAYIPKYKTGEEGVIVNISSIAGVKDMASNPVYTATKFAVTELSKAFGNVEHYKRTKVKVLTLCPGLTETPILEDIFRNTLGQPYQKLAESTLEAFTLQTPESVAFAASKIVKNAKTGTVWVIEAGQDPYEFVWPSRESFAPK